MDFILADDGFHIKKGNMAGHQLTKSPGEKKKENYCYCYDKRINGEKKSFFFN